MKKRLKLSKIIIIVVVGVVLATVISTFIVVINSDKSLDSMFGKVKRLSQIKIDKTTQTAGETSGETTQTPESTNTETTQTPESTNTETTQTPESTNTETTQTIESTEAVACPDVKPINGIFNIDDFGAIANDLIDDSRAIQCAIDATSKEHIGIVEIPVGIYRHNKTLRVKYNITLSGRMRGGATLLYTNTKGFAIEMEGFSGLFRVNTTSMANGVNILGQKCTIKETLIRRAYQQNLAVGAIGTIGLQVGDGKDPIAEFQQGRIALASYFSYVEPTTTVRGFGTLLKVMAFSNTNFIEGSLVTTIGTDGAKAEKFIWIDGGSANQINVGIEGNVTEDARAIYINDSPKHGCYGNKIHLLWSEFYKEKDLPFSRPKIEFKEPTTYGNEIWDYRAAVLTYKDVIYNGNPTNKLHFLSSMFQAEPNYMDFSRNLLDNGELRYAQNSTTGILPHSWKTYGNPKLSDDGTTLYNYKTIKFESSGTTRIYYELPAGTFDTIKGTVATFGFWGKTSASNVLKGRVNFYDDLTDKYTDSYWGRDFGFHSGNGEWGFLQVSFPPISSKIKKIVLDIECVNGTAYIALPTLVLGTKINESFPKPYSGGSTMYGPLVHNIVKLRDSATPDVSGGSLFVTGGTTAITDFIGGVSGQELKIIAKHNIIIKNGGNILLKENKDFEMKPEDTLTLINQENKWYDMR